ncbi:MAG: tetratricopeptide repeat protein [Bacteroidetes bacterium]|nr:tetratricopeptide repeat protein [Bacteroidota bacterium]HET6245399.1 tetratricopeptide repeat protein [Bacteroidia bacterium]
MKKLFSLLLLLTALFANNQFCQASGLDSLKVAYKISSEDSVRVIILNKLTDEMWRMGSYSKAEKCAQYAQKIARASNFKSGIAGALNNLGIINMIQGKYPEALEFFFHSLKISEELNNQHIIAKTLSNIGSVYWNKKDMKTALEYYYKSLKIYEDVKDKVGVSNSYNNIGVVFAENDEEPKALEYYNMALAIQEKLGSKKEAANTLNNIGNIYWNMDSLETALRYQFQALEMRELNDDKQGVAMSLVNIGGVYLDLKKYNEALLYFNKSKQFALEMGIPLIAKESEMLISNSYDLMGDVAKAFDHYKRYISYRDSIFNEENTKSIVRSEMKYEYSKREQEAKLKQEKKEALHQLEFQKQTLQRNALIAGFGLMFALAGVSFRSYRNKRKANNLLAIQNKEIITQKATIEGKNKDIMDSIKYAKRIQEAILPPSNLLKKILPEHFVLYKPKDIVSGDFYWISPLNNHKGIGMESFLLAAVDCTGHGVPGALMSIVGHNGLTRAVKENHFIKPSDILNYLNHSVHETLRQSYEESSVKDGMDIALVNINCKEHKLEFAGANNPLLIVRNGNIIEIKGDKQPIGSFTGDNLRPFKNNEVPIFKGDCIYIFTDGYVDQFGGPKGKKFKYTQLKELLLKINNESMPLQCNILNEKIEKWKGNLEQVDDICIIGVRIL